jgi:hypothetical protein
VARSAAITVGGQIFSVNQPAAACTYTISPASQAFGAAGGNNFVTVTTSAGCTWSATSNASWVTISNGTNRTGFGTVNFAAAANTTTAARSATLTIAGNSFVVTEPSASCSFAVAPLLVTASPGGGAGTITVTTAAGCAWTISTSASWVTLSGGSGTGSGSASYTFPANLGTFSRSAILSVSGVQVTILQNPTTNLTTNMPPGPNNLRIIK